jgi:peptidoglycan/LPS O-acetylase OafA/YrhL
MSASHKLAGLDVLRALAITLVLFFHYRIFAHPAWMDGNRVIGFGWTGVDLFFVLSGYLIAGQLFAQKHIDLKTFFYKRFFRIIPPYALVVALYFLFPYLRERDTIPPFWKFATFTQNLGLDLRTQGTFSHAWSLCIEEQFYLLLPLILLLFRRFKASYRTAFICIVTLFLSMTLTRWLSWHYAVQPVLDTDNAWLPWYKWIYYPTFTRLDGLLMGVGLAGLHQFNTGFRTWLDKNGHLMLGIGVILLCVAFVCCKEDMDPLKTFAGFPLVALAYGCIVASAISPTCFLYSVRLRPITGLATLSYAIYLTHKIVIHVIQSFVEDKQSGWLMAVCLVASVCAAQLVRWVIEKPALKMRNKVLQPTEKARTTVSEPA